MKFQNPIGGKDVTPEMIPTATIRARARRNNWTREKIERVAVVESEKHMLRLAVRFGVATVDKDGNITQTGDVICERCDTAVDAGNFMILPDQSPAHRFKCE